MNKEEAVSIAREYFQTKSDKVFELQNAWYDDGTEEGGLFYGTPTWKVWFDPHNADGTTVHELIVYVDVEKAEAWTMNFGPDPETLQNLKTLAQMLQVFISGQDQSLRYANEIEGLLINKFIDNETIFDMLSLPLASYRPGGGEQLYDEEMLIKTFQDFLKEFEPELEAAGSE